MSDKNFSWGILGLTLGLVVPLLAIVALVMTGNSDTAAITTLGGISVASLTGLSGVMNPSRKFDSDTQTQQTIDEAKVAAQQAMRATGEVKKMLQ